MWPVVMTDLGGYRVCAKRGGLPFKDAVRVNVEGKCTQAGFKRCNPDSDVDNAFCVAEGTVCPITSVKFVNSLDELHDALQDQTYKIEDVVGSNGWPKGLKAVK